jgi:replicative DNA helicase
MNGEDLLGVSLRQPPANLEAEQALLGALLANNKAYDRVADAGLRVEHFADPVHGAVFHAVQQRIEAGQLVDVVTLRTELEGSGQLDEVGGARYLAELLSAMVGIINAGEYARVIRDLWIRRQLIELGEQLVNRGFGAEPEHDAAAQLALAEGALYALGEGRAGEATVMSSTDAAEAALRQMQAARAAKGGLVGLTYGYRALDRMTGGLRGTQFVVVGARPAMGKTALAAGIAVGAARVGGRVLFVSCEMDAPSVAARLVAAQARMPLSAVLRGGVEEETPEGRRFRQITDREADAIGEAVRQVGLLPITFDALSSPTVAQVRNRARRLKRRGGLDLVVVDYLGLMRASDSARRQNRNIEVSEISQGLKALAVELNVPVVALSQLSREVEKRDDKTPVMSDLRDSGSLEQDADLIMFLYREHYYLKQHPPVRRQKEKVEDFELRQEEWSKALERSQGRAELFVSKQRQGPTGRVRLRFADHLTWFFDESDPSAPGGAAGGEGEA